MSNPILYFSLLGRTNSGKTCLFTALKAPKEKNVKEIDFTFSSQDQFNVAVEKLKKEKYLESGFKYEEMESELTRYVKDLENGKKQDGNKLGHKKLYVFSYTKDNTGADLALFDYAGETLNIETKTIKEDNKTEIKKDEQLTEDNKSEIKKDEQLTEENKSEIKNKEQSVNNNSKSSIKNEIRSQKQKSNKKEFNSYPYLKDLLKQMDAIFAIIGIPNSKEEDKFIKEIDDLKSAFKRVGFETEEGSIKIKIPIVLMVTKFDRYITNNKLDFNNYEECKKHFEASKYYEELEDLIRLIKNNTGKDRFKVFYTSAFGECSDNDIPIKREKLRPINLLEPFEFAVEKVSKNKLEECKVSEKRNLLTVLFKPSEYFNQAINIMPIFPENSEEKKELTRINTFLKSQRFNRAVFFILFALFAYLFGDCYFDYKYYQELQLEAKTAKDCQERIDSLIKFKDSDYYHHILARITFLDKKEIESKISLLKQRKKEKELKELENESNPDLRIAKSKKLLDENPTRENAEQINNIKKNSLKEIWNSKANNLKRDLENKIVNEQITSKDEIVSFTQRLLNLENDKESRDMQLLTDLKSCFENLRKANSRKDWEKLAFSIESEIQFYKNNSKDFSQDNENRLSEDIKTLNNKPRESFEKDGEYKNRFDKISADFKDLIVIKKKTAWEVKVSSFTTDLDLCVKDGIIIEKYNELSEKLNLIVIEDKENSLGEFEICNGLKSKLENAHLVARIKDWETIYVNPFDIKLANLDGDISKEKYDELIDDLDNIKANYDSDFNKEDKINKLEEKLNNAYQEFKDKGWIKKFNEIKASLSNYSLKGEKISDNDYKVLLKSINTLSSSDSEKEDKIESLRNELEKAFRNTKEKDWQDEFNRISREVKYIDLNNVKMDNDKHDNLLKSVDKLYSLLTESDSTKKKQLDSLKNNINKVYIDGQTQDWRAKKLNLENNLDNLSKITDINVKKTKIDGLESILDNLREIAKLKSSWNLEEEYKSIETKYNDIKNNIYSKFYDSEYTKRINQAENYSYDEDIDEKIKTFDELIKLKRYIYENRYQISITDKEFCNRSITIIDRILNYTKKEIDKVIKNEDFNSARDDFLEKVYANNNLKDFLKFYNVEKKLFDEYENLAKKIDYAEFNHEYSKLFEITNQDYKEIFSRSNSTFPLRF